MAKKKRKNKNPYKRITINQAYKTMNEMCIQLEQVTLKTLHSEFGFGEKRQERFMNEFRKQMNAYLLQQEREMRKQTRI